jgi:hypothetical protein
VTKVHNNFDCIKYDKQDQQGKAALKERKPPHKFNFHISYIRREQIQQQQQQQINLNIKKNIVLIT